MGFILGILPVARQITGETRPTFCAKSTNQASSRNVQSWDGTIVNHSNKKEKNSRFAPMCVKKCSITFIGQPNGIARSTFAPTTLSLRSTRVLLFASSRRCDCVQAKRHSTCPCTTTTQHPFQPAPSFHCLYHLFSILWCIFHIIENVNNKPHPCSLFGLFWCRGSRFGVEDSVPMS